MKDISEVCGYVPRVFYGFITCYFSDNLLPETSYFCIFVHAVIFSVKTYAQPGRNLVGTVPDTQIEIELFRGIRWTN